MVLTYPAQGHINPLLQFSKRLASKGLKATLATTHYTVNFIQSDAVGVEAISDGFDEGGFKQAPSLEAYLESFQAVGSRTVGELILKFNESASPVDCLVYDSILPWGLSVARQFGIYGAAFWTTSASVCSMYWQLRQGVLSLPVKQEPVPVSMPGLPPLRLSDLPDFLAQPGHLSAYMSAVMEQISSLEQNDWVFMNSFDALESELVKAMSGLWSVAMIGPMVPSAYLDQQIEGDTVYGASLWKPTNDECLGWLETKPPKSVVYISFGSMAEIPVKQVEEIAWGLKESDYHFIWVVKESESGKLPINFLNSMNETGLVVTWCNQLEVLAHKAVGCFVTHCGWNSILEGLSLGVPMVGMPQRVDQPTNAKFVEDVWRAGVRAQKDEEGIVTRKELEKCIKEIMVGERSEEIKRNACMWRESAKSAVSKGGSSDKNTDEFVGVLLKRGKKKT